ncbi:MAG: GNAT family N-acetyltransferase [Verrucomicrobiota bacterium]
MDYRLAKNEDLDLLAHWNEQLIIDEGQSRPINREKLAEDMAKWLADSYQAVLFSVGEKDVAYALFREGNNEIYLRQFFVRRDQRRLGLGRIAVSLLREEVWTPKKRICVAALVDNPVAINFWKAVGFTDYAVTLTIPPE